MNIIGDKNELERITVLVTLIDTHTLVVLAFEERVRSQNSNNIYTVVPFNPTT